MAGNSKRTIIQLESTAGTGYRYTFTKSKKRHPGRIEFRKFDPIFNSSKVFIFILSSQVSDLVLLNVIVDSSPREFHHLKTHLIYVMLN